ncbi:signal peptidase [Skermanella stibiiresistens SB22]|uniref:Signal peptidase I n=1 Tax=Skermanella stibiiresistens SB22 TaxID=1385369 RepID=W9H8Q8_9PROT|nr:signal peptidase [Skermanella stibiiresistens SB22]
MTELTRKQIDSMQKNKSGGIGETIKTVVYAVVIAFGVRTFAYEPFNIPSGSMIPTLLVGDYLFVSKFSYGYSKYTVAFGADLFDGRLLYTKPERGDVAVFKLPRDNKTDYIKRIVGLPGDRIQMIGGILHINGEAVKREKTDDFVTTDQFGRQMRVTQYIETLPNGRQHRIIEESDNASLDNTPVYVVPENHFFCMGDNRDNSLDSRVGSMVGFVPVENLVGRAEFLFFSLDEGARFWEFWKWPWSVRFGRIFDGVN